jgi:hypothetical protein
MNYVMVHHRVQNYSRWIGEYEAHGPERTKAGLSEVRLMQGVEDENDVTLLFEAKDLDKAKAFVVSNNLKDAMKKAGVVGAPEVTYYTDSGAKPH